MKATLLYIFSAICVICGLVSCSDDNQSDLQLAGNCMVENISLDHYEGTADMAQRTITVRVPQNYRTEAMKVTGLKVSDGASCNITEGQTLNMEAAKTIHVQNQDEIGRASCRERV